MNSLPLFSSGFTKELFPLSSVYPGLLPHPFYLCPEFLDGRCQFLGLLDIMPLGLSLAVQNLQEMEMLLFQLLSLFQYLAIPVNGQIALLIRPNLPVIKISPPLPQIKEK